MFDNPNAKLSGTWELGPSGWSFSFNSHLIRLTPSVERFKGFVSYTRNFGPRESQEIRGPTAAPSRPKP